MEKKDKNGGKVVYDGVEELRELDGMSVLYWYKEVEVLVLIVCLR